jgi:hypothetical protein
MTDAVQRGHFHRTLDGRVCQLSDRCSPAFVIATARSPLLLAPTRDKRVCRDRHTLPHHRQTWSSGHVIALERQTCPVPSRWTRLSRRTAARPRDRRGNSAMHSVCHGHVPASVAPAHTGQARVWRQTSHPASVASKPSVCRSFLRDASSKTCSA